LRIRIPVFVVALVFAVPTTAFLCGKERWPVKTCTDPHNKFLFKNAKTTGKLKTPKKTDIKTLIAIENPFTGHLPPKFNRVTGTETTIWKIEATVFLFVKEDDEDYHLALKDDQGRTMVAEIPAPNCLKKTPEALKDLILQARQDFDKRFTATGTPKDANVRVVITGPAMFDKKHPKNPLGDAANHIEIHPIISIRFID
jgi:hypothetical protein